MQRRHHHIAILAALAVVAALGVLRFSHPAASVEEEWFRAYAAERAHRALEAQSARDRRIAQIVEQRHQINRQRKAKALESAGVSDQRVAHCMLGQGRTMAHPMIHQNYEAHVLSKIGAPSDVFFVIDAPNKGTEAFDPVVVDYVPIPNGKHQFDRWLRCMTMVLEREKGTGVRYSHVIINRADQLVLQDLPSIETFPREGIWGKPYGETMDEYPSTYTHGDEGAVEPHTLWALSDLFLVLPRQVAGVFIDTLAQMNPHRRRTLDCGKWGFHRRHVLRPEALLTCVVSARAIPVTLQPFQLRLLRDHAAGGCPSYSQDVGKHYNSLCA